HSRRHSWRMAPCGLARSAPCVGVRFSLCQNASVHIHGITGEAFTTTLTGSRARVDPASSPRPHGPEVIIVSQPIKVGVAIRYLRRLSNWKIWNGKEKPRASFRTFGSVYDGVESENKIIELP